MRGSSQRGLGHDRVHFGGNSGFQAINLAFLWGATRIILLGFDCKAVAGKDHWFGQHPQGLKQVQPYNLWLEHYPQLAYDLKREGVTVINCSRDTAINCFERATIETVTD